MSRARDLADGNFSGDLEADSPTFVVDSANNRVGVGTSSPSHNLHVSSSAGSTLALTAGSTENAQVRFGDSSDDDAGKINYDNSTNHMAFHTNASERVRIDSSGTLLVGKTATDSGVVGFEAAPTGVVYVTVNNTLPFYINRQSGSELLRFASNGSTVGNISTYSGDLTIGTGDMGLRFDDNGNALYPVNANNGSPVDNLHDLGDAFARWDDVWATNATIQTSDRNDKQDIEALSDAEQRVAVAAKGLMRKYRWKSAVERKGDEARIHFGIIAQDLQAAFEAEGLDAGRYGMFISSTWWEADRVIPAVEEELDDEGNVLVEAQPERVVTDTFETLEEAPEGAVQRTRLGVRYPELLAFIIAAL